MPHTAMNSCGCLRCDRGRGRAHHNNELQMVWFLRRACGHADAEDRNAIFHFSCFSFLVTAKISSYTPLYLTTKVLVCANGLGTNDGTGTPFSPFSVFSAEMPTIEFPEFILLYFTLQLGTMRFQLVCSWPLPAFTGETCHDKDPICDCGILAALQFQASRFDNLNVKNLIAPAFDFQHVSMHEPELRPQDWGNLGTMFSANFLSNTISIAKAQG